MTDRYLLFAGERYYPAGGWRDFKMSFPSPELAEKAVTGFGDDYDWWQIVDHETRAIIKEARKKNLADGYWEVAKRVRSVPTAKLDSLATMTMT